MTEMARPIQPTIWVWRCFFEFFALTFTMSARRQEKEWMSAKKLESYKISTDGKSDVIMSIVMTVNPRSGDSHRFRPDD
jgi:hypothetical protein